MDMIAPTWKQDMKFQRVDIDQRAYWISFSVYELRWRQLADVLGVSRGSSQSADLQGPSSDIFTHLLGEIGIRDVNLATEVAHRFVREGFESWEDVLHVFDFVGGKSPYDGVMKYLTDTGIPFAVAGKITSYIQKNM
jgi:hypothetical protein